MVFGILPVTKRKKKKKYLAQAPKKKKYVPSKAALINPVSPSQIRCKFKIRESLLLILQRIFNLLDELSSIHGTFKTVTGFSILENDERRQCFYLVFVSNAWVLLRINFNHLDFIAQRNADLVKDGNHELTWSTPGCIEVY